MANFQIDDKDAVVTPALDDELVCSQSGIPKKITTEQILSLSSNQINLINLGWMVAPSTWTYVSADANFPQYTFSIVGDATSYIFVGQKIKYTQTTVKYGIVVKVTYATGITTVIIYGGGNLTTPSYSMANAIITNPYYATIHRPLDFPISIDTWSIILTDGTKKTKTNPSSGTWYGGANAWTTGTEISLYLGIGLWDVNVKVTGYIFNFQPSGDDDAVINFALSDSSSNPTNENFKCYFSKFHDEILGVTGFIKNNLTLTSTTKYYLLSNTIFGLGVILNFEIWGDKLPTTIKAKCLYL
jgi:hypothetical protein